MTRQGAWVATRSGVRRIPERPTVAASSHVIAGHDRLIQCSVFELVKTHSAMTLEGLQERPDEIC